jgi:hypothetical protein
VYLTISVQVSASISVALSEKPCTVSEAEYATLAFSINAGFKKLVESVINKKASPDVSLNQRLSLSAEFLNSSPLEASATVVTLVLAFHDPIGLSGYSAKTLPPIGAVLNSIVVAVIA